MIKTLKSQVYIGQKALNRAMQALWRPFWKYANQVPFPSRDIRGLLVCCYGDLIEMHCGKKPFVGIFSKLTIIQPQIAWTISTGMKVVHAANEYRHVNPDYCIVKYRLFTVFKGKVSLRSRGNHLCSTRVGIYATFIQCRSSLFQLTIWRSFEAHRQCMDTSQRDK